MGTVSVGESGESSMRREVVQLLSALLLCVSYSYEEGHYQYERDLAVQLREGRSLVNSFPFTEARPTKQYDDGPAVDFNSVADASAAGQKCIDKIIEEEETEYDEVYECNHSYNKRCTTSYTTTYEAQQEEECEDNYKKNCFIEYSKTAYDTEVEVCVEPLVKDCDAEGPEVCSTEYQSECETVQHEHDVEDDVVECRNEIESKCEDVTSGYTSSEKCSNWPVQKCDVQRKPVKKFTPETSCSKVPVELCGPASCPTVPGPKQCYQTRKTIAGEKPEEECSLEPKRVCKFVTKLVPQLKPHESCLDVPKEVCVRSQTNPRKVKKPVIKKWCYTPSAESGLSVIDSASESLPQSQPPPPSCPTRCRDAVRSGNCDPSCNSYTNICGSCVPRTTAPPPQCPARCRDAVRTGNCDPSCNKYNSVCGECTPPPPVYNPPPQYNPPPKTTPPPPQCPSRCQDAITTGNCEPSCNSYNSICGRCTPRTTPPPPKCPSKCRNAIQTGNCDPSCDAYNSICGPCSPPPPLYSPPPSQPTGGYLPPPETSRSFSPQLRNSVVLPSQSQFSRKNPRKVQTSPAQIARLPRNKKKTSLGVRGGRKNTSPTRRPRNNWDLYFREGIVKRKG